MNALSGEQVRAVALLYTAAAGPLVLLLALRAAGRLPRWVAAVYGASFLLCALGWEIWLTFGLVGGAPVDARRPAALAHAIPQWLNWAVNSLGDAGAICMGGLLLVWLAYGRCSAPFRRWRWGAFALLGLWFVAQNVWVELVLYQGQLATGQPLSWAPLMPNGPWWNPALELGSGRTLQLQTQLPWLLMTPIFYAVVLRCHARWAGPAPGRPA